MKKMVMYIASDIRLIALIYIVSLLANEFSHDEQEEMKQQMRDILAHLKEKS